jgi:hypothetical protein
MRSQTLAGGAVFRLAGEAQRARRWRRKESGAEREGEGRLTVKATRPRESPGETAGEVSADPYRRTLHKCGRISSQTPAPDSEIYSA